MSNQREVIVTQLTNNQSSPLPVFVTNSTAGTSGWAAVAISLLASIILLWSSRLQFKSQRLKFINEINSDCFYIVYELKHRVEKDNFPAEHYYRRCWSQLFCEFSAWQDGVINDDTYTRWLRQEKPKYEIILRSDIFLIGKGIYWLNLPLRRSLISSFLI
jgi:hypothetical protein